MPFLKEIIPALNIIILGSVKDLAVFSIGSVLYKTVFTVSLTHRAVAQLVKDENS